MPIDSGGYIQRRKSQHGLVGAQQPDADDGGFRPRLLGLRHARNAKRHRGDQGADLYFHARASPEVFPKGRHKNARPQGDFFPFVALCLFKGGRCGL